jgi:hypothetical protein
MRISLAFMPAARDCAPVDTLPIGLQVSSFAGEHSVKLPMQRWH